MNFFSLPSRAGGACLLCLLCLFALAACGASSSTARNGSIPAPVQAQPVAGGDNAPLQIANMSASWVPLVKRLQADKVPDSALAQYFPRLAEYSPQPMSVKIKELYKSAYGVKKPPKVDDGQPKLPPSSIYRNIVTAANVEKCNAFLASNKTVFDAVEKKYPVPRETLVSLLFVETRLGTYMGTENAFWSLACMAAADTPDMVRAGLTDLPLTEAHNTWLQAKLTDKSNWAYKELKALLTYCTIQKVDPHGMPGSVYGAIGICQFMPSNLEPYGDDGDGDGVVNLFSEPDAIFSTARYLTRHGWAAGLSVGQQRDVLKRYNNLNKYANTILALAETMRTGVLQTGPPDAVKPAGKSKGAAKATGKAAKPAAASKAPAGKAPAATGGKAAPKAAPATGKKAAPKGNLP